MYEYFNQITIFNVFPTTVIKQGVLTTKMTSKISQHALILYNGDLL
jgi:hypothetical protein